MTISAELRARIRRLFYAEHWPVGTIVAQLGVHPDTVKRAIETERFVSRGRARPSDFDAHVDFVRDVLTQYPTLTGSRVWQMLRARGYPGSAIQVRRKIRALGLRPKPRSEAYFRLSVLPGEQGQVDWGHFGELQVGNARRKLSLFVVTLSWSRAFHVHFSFDQSASSVARGHVAAFEAFGGVPRNLLYDNMKTAVIERAGDAIRFHPGLLELSAHYLFEPHACTPRRANEKGRVERRIGDLRRSFFAARRFCDLADLRAQFRRWRDEVAYQRPCPADRTLTVADALRRERDALLPLAAEPFCSDEIRTVVANKQPYIAFDGNLYSIPYQLVSVQLTLVASDEVVRLVTDQQVVASHARRWGRGEVSEERDHLRGLGRTKRAARAQASRALLIDAVPGAQALFTELARRDERLGPQTAQLLALVERYGAQQVGDAITEAIERGTPRAASVALIVERAARATGQAPRVPTRISDRPDIQDLRVSTHSLEDYDALAEDSEPDPL